jgi:Flp pilus assembly protein TadD
MPTPFSKFGRFDEAIATYKKIVELHPKEAKSWAHLGHFNTQASNSQTQKHQFSQEPRIGSASD